MTITGSDPETDPTHHPIPLPASRGERRRCEIARALGRTDGATKVLIHRAIKQLTEQMEEGSGDDE